MWDISALFDPEYFFGLKIEIPQNSGSEGIGTIGWKDATRVSGHMHDDGPEMSQIRGVRGQIDDANPPGRPHVFGPSSRFLGVFSQAIGAVE